MAITRDEILRRARAVPLGSISYSQGGTNASGPAKGYRRDCSGFVSYCWACPTSGPGSWGGYSTATFVIYDVMYEIPRAQLQPGDAIGYCGPTTAGSGGGHIALWLGKSGSKEHILDHGSGMGPKDRYVTWGTGSGWQAAGKLKAWRFRGLSGPVAPALIERDSDMAVIARHGDGGETVTKMQKEILAAGGSLPRWGADGSYGDETAAALRALVGGGDGRVYDSGDRALLTVLAAQRKPAQPAPVDQAAVDKAVAAALANVKATTTLTFGE